VPCSKDLLRAFTLVLIPSGQADDDTARLKMRRIFLHHFPVRQVVDRPVVVSVVTYVAYHSVILGERRTSPHRCSVRLDDAVDLRHRRRIVDPRQHRGRDLEIERGRQERRATRNINRFGEYVGGVVLAVGMLAPFVLALTESDYFWIANAMYLAFVLSAFTSSVVKVVVYRRGL
jgi:hypothetical protein